MNMYEYKNGYLLELENLAEIKDRISEIDGKCERKYTIKQVQEILKIKAGSIIKPLGKDDWRSGYKQRQDEIEEILKQNI